ncbi:unnamed protein product [Heligmosomoides polygyrus]|uniref:Secreted protein n=1 Tax=Heligmosomoides polygyrus TaxID=6339 RepID=A0A183FI38_HELPZ|nr:unnamed protein product [Heligmosomoides polygyrus]
MLTASDRLPLCCARRRVAADAVVGDVVDSSGGGVSDIADSVVGDGSITPSAEPSATPCCAAKHPLNTVAGDVADAYKYKIG